MDYLIKRVNEVHNDIVRELNDNHLHFLRNLDEWKNGPNPYFQEHIDSALTFVSKYLEWETTSGDTRHWKHQMFREIIPQDTDVFGPLLHFIGYHVYDDGSFSVKWYRDVYERDEKGFRTCEYLRREEVEPASCPKSYPVLVDDFYGVQDPKVIVDAMVLHEENQKRAQEAWERKVEESMVWLREYWSGQSSD